MKVLNNTYNYDLREYQLRSVPLLEVLDECCRKHGITYYIVYGTLLGAVRHKGFIPWDDDMDIAILRSDYDKLMEHAEEWLPKPYFIVNHKNTPHYPKHFAKLEDASTTIVENINLGYKGGIYIDIFPLDEVPDNALLRRWHFLKFKLFRRMLYFAFRDPYKHGRGPKSWMPLIVQKLIGKAWVQRNIQRVMQEYKGKKNCSHLSAHGATAYPKPMFGVPQRMEFEGFMANAPTDSVNYLITDYGKDYMQLPPIEKRIAHFHHYCDFNTPYAEFDINTLKKQ